MLNKLKKIAKDLLAIVWVRRLYEGLMRAVLEVLAANRFLSLIYSVLSIPTFNREQFAVLRGRRDYYRNLARERASRTELRRNIHRLEKGILMRPRRKVFGLDYLIETIEFYERAVAHYVGGAAADEGEMVWAYGVLNDYFSIVDKENPVVARAYNRFDATMAEFKPDDATKAPYRRADTPMSKVAYEDLLALAMQRRSVRWFEQRPVPRDLIDKALLVGRQSPTACNRLPYEFRIFDDPMMVKKVAAIPFGSAGYSHQIPTVIVVIGRLNHYFSPRDRHVIYVDAALAAMPFMMALETLGLASSVINWPDFEPLEAKMQKALNLDYDERVIMLIAVGYADPDGLIAYSEKKSLDVLRRYNDLGEKVPSKAQAEAGARPQSEPKLA
ncbi:nitroreductase family protein [Aquibium oceanicum]|uniref:NADH dehydrogenase n=1 Tax=Aquibium oceanicum TaxID=1670800 RepID=A0A1L3SU95_9HYPH|nr:nitroreductase family protein [Aquibium oceanicum]APH72950.1 NADH dehydrogenase [Aquibium oceanicum]